MGPFMIGHLDLTMRRHFRSQGKHFFAINRLMEGFNPNTIQMAVTEADLTTPGVVAKFEELCSTEEKITQPKLATVDAIGDGSLLKNLIAAIQSFMSSDFGKALIAALEKALIGFLIP